MRTSEAVTPAPDVPSSLLVFTVLYLGLAVALVVLLLRLAGGKLPTGGSTAAQETEAGHVP